MCKRKEKLHSIIFTSVRRSKVKLIIYYPRTPIFLVITSYFPINTRFNTSFQTIWILSWLSPTMRFLFVYGFNSLFRRSVFAALY